MRDKGLEKNILDLKHSVNLTKAGTFLALSFTSWIVVFFGMKEFYLGDIKINILIATLVSAIFLYYAIKFFKKCEDIHNHIKNI